MFGSSKMSVSASCESVSQKRSVTSLLAGRVLKKPKPEDKERLQQEAIQLLEQQQDLGGLFREVGNLAPCSNLSAAHKFEGVTGSLLAAELQRLAAQHQVVVSALAVKVLLERLMEITEEEEEDEEEGEREMLSPAQRARLGQVLQSSRELLSQGLLCPRQLGQEIRRHQKLPTLEILYHLHIGNVLPLKHIVESEEEVRSWLVSQMKTLCGWTPPQEEEETKQVQQDVLSAVVGLLVSVGFEPLRDSAAERRMSALCGSALDDMLFWLLDAADTSQSAAGGAERWMSVLEASPWGVSASPDALRRFFTHSLTQTLTYRPQLTVSDAVSLQSRWTFAKSSRTLTALLRQLAAISSVEQLLCHLQKVLETHEVNWKHVLSFCSTVLVYYHTAQHSLTELLSRLLMAAFHGYDLENMITAFLLARQAALEGTAVFPSYSHWFKVTNIHCSI